MTRYGNQEGALRGYNPKKKGRNSHHPLMAFVADVRMVANFWLRSGNTSASNNFLSFLEDTLSRLEGKKVGLIRCDSGFYSDDIFSYLEQGQRPFNYIIAAKFYTPLKRVLAAHLSSRSSRALRSEGAKSKRTIRSRPAFCICRTVQVVPHEVRVQLSAS